MNGYLEILEDTLMAYRLPAFEARLRERKHPNLYWVDPGLVRAHEGAVRPEAAFDLRIQRDLVGPEVTAAERCRAHRPFQPGQCATVS